MEQNTDGLKELEKSLIYSEQYQEIANCVSELKKVKDLSEYGENELCMLISSHLDRKYIKHEVVRGIYYDSKAFLPMLYTDEAMIVPMSSETITLSIIIPLNNWKYKAPYGLYQS